jgi:hypothetical protein
MHASHERGLVADLARAVSRTGPVRGASIPGNAYERDIETGRRRDEGKPHERRQAGESWHDGSIDGLECLVCHVLELPYAGSALSSQIDDLCRFQPLLSQLHVAAEHLGLAKDLLIAVTRSASNAVMSLEMSA